MDRLAHAAMDARDCLTRAAALYAQHWRDAAYQTSKTNDAGKVSGGKPGSRAPVGDVELHAALRASTRHLARCIDALTTAVGGGEPPHYPLTSNAAPTIVALHTMHAARMLRNVERSAEQLAAIRRDDPTEAEQAAEQAKAKTRRRIFDACAEARSALAAWDTPVETTQMRHATSEIGHARAAAVSRAEHGTAITPPRHWPGPSPKRCKRKGCQGADGKPRLIGQRKDICDACAKRDSRNRRKAS